MKQKPQSNEEDLIARCIEIIRCEQKASASLFMRRLKIGFTRAERILKELEQRGVIGPAEGPRNSPEPREILNLPVASPGTPSGTIPEAKPKVKKEEKPELPPGLAVLRAFFEFLPPTEHQMVPYLENDLVVPDPLPGAVAKKLKFKSVSLFEKRGLTSVTCEAMGLRANPPANETLLHGLETKHSWEELRASGLWLDANQKFGLDRRPNPQFHGKGQIGKKPERERRERDDKWVWGMCEPVLIPYFDEAGDLVKLRPHKGGAPAGTMAGRSQIYVPRDYKQCAGTVEKFNKVVICEGEFKAIAIWQTLGLGARLQVDAEGRPLGGRHQKTNFEPVGVCSLPGISFGKHVEMRIDLERWLEAVGCRRVVVAFDDEDKSDQPLARRFDALIAAQTLAVELSKTLHVEARVCVLPHEWRNARGKSDWDGGLVKIIQNQKGDV